MKGDEKGGADNSDAFNRSSRYYSSVYVAYARRCRLHHGDDRAVLLGACGNGDCD